MIARLLARIFRRRRNRRFRPSFLAFYLHHYNKPKKYQ
jgi:hypothetical protein